MPTPLELEAQRQLAAGALFPGVEIQRRITGSRTVNVVAEHCTGWDAGGRQTQFTRLSERTADGPFICNVEGFLPEGSEVQGQNGWVYVARLLASAQDRRAA